jgi:hypothetical protein
VLTDAQYVDLIEADLKNYHEAPASALVPQPEPPVFFGGNPGITSPVCTARMAAYNRARQKFQDDLERSEPPSRLRAVHQMLRQDLATVEAFDKDADRIVATGNQAKFDEFYQSPFRQAVLKKLDDDVLQAIRCARTLDQECFERVCRHGGSGLS